MSDDYDDGSIEVSDEGLRIRHYYVPFGGKHIRYSDIRAVERVPMGALTGRARVWGTANPRYWASLDLKRPRKKTGFIVDSGGPVKSFITPDDPKRFEAALGAHVPITPRSGRIVI
jgi:hypothetical protein